MRPRPRRRQRNASVEFQPGRLRERHVVGDLAFDQRIDFLRLQRHRLDALRRELLLHLDVADQVAQKMMSLLKGLPSAYDKDLQEDKVPVFETFDTLNLMLPVDFQLVFLLKDLTCPLWVSIK